MKSTSGCKLLVHLWLDHPGQVIRIDFTSLHLTWSAHVHFINLNANWWLDSLSLILLNLIFLQPTSSPKEEGKKKKKGGGKTVSSVYLVSLGELMVRCWPIFYQNVACSFSFLCLLFYFFLYIAPSQTTLHNCEPHFVRCLVPNTHKKPGEVGTHNHHNHNLDSWLT